MIKARQPRMAILVFALSLALILLVALAQRSGWLTSLDQGLMNGAGAHRGGLGGVLTSILLLASQIGGTTGRTVIALMAAAALIFAGGRHHAVWFLATVIGGTLLNLALKQLFAAPRPDLLPHLDRVDTYSFPSGHAAGSAILFGALALAIGRRWAWGLALPLIVMIGVSRVWLGVHWPTDVVAGWIEAAGWLTFCACWMPLSYTPPPR